MCVHCACLENVYLGLEKVKWVNAQGVHHHLEDETLPELFSTIAREAAMKMKAHSSFSPWDHAAGKEDSETEYNQWLRQGKCWKSLADTNCYKIK